jgi:dTMP kinase
VLVAFEGGEGTGKTTQVVALATLLRARGLDVVETFEPGDSSAGAQVRRIVLGWDDAELTARAEALLYAADRAEHVERVLQPALARGAVVVTDRFVDSSVAYQGAGRGLDTDEVARLNRFATGGLVPDLTVLLDLDPAEGLRRVADPDRVEREPLDFHRRVRECYLRLVAAAPDRYVVVDASASAAAVQAEVAAAVLARLEPAVQP